MQTKFKIGDRVKLLNPVKMAGLRGTITNVYTGKDSPLQIFYSEYYDIELDKTYRGITADLKKVGRSENEIALVYTRKGKRYAKQK